MGQQARLTACPITTQQRAAMRAAMHQVERVLRDGCTAQQMADARAALTELDQKQQPQLQLNLKPCG